MFGRNWDSGVLAGIDLDQTHNAARLLDSPIGRQGGSDDPKNNKIDHVRRLSSVAVCRSGAGIAAAGRSTILPEPSQTRTARRAGRADCSLSGQSPVAGVDGVDLSTRSSECGTLA